MPDLVSTPHFAFPFVRGPGGRVNVVEQDTDEHVMACENVIVRCPVGFRDERPEFGIPWPDFKNAPLDVGGIEEALQRFEPRSRATAADYADVIDAATQTVRVEVS
jgi:phage baseplate assembly protein W